MKKIVELQSACRPHDPSLSITIVHIDTIDEQLLNVVFETNVYTHDAVDVADADTYHGRNNDNHGRNDTHGSNDCNNNPNHHDSHGELNAAKLHHD